MQSVVVEGQISHTIPVTSGVPQGSVLGPLLFLLYINDLPECVSSQSTIRLFADDSFLYRKIRSATDSIQLQHDLDQLAVWEQSWLMSFNPSKCQLLPITKKRSPIQHDYTLHGHVLEQVPKAKYLGLNLHEQLSWNFHTDVTAKKANRTRAFIARNIHSCPKKVKAACYTTVVRPMMEYATTAWAPHTVQNCHKLKQVQQRAARFACHRYEKTASVTAMINDLKWESLETRRNNQRLTMFYRMQHNMVSFTPADHLVPVTAEDQVMAKCIKFLTLGPMSTSTLSFQQLYARGTLYLHL